jgi:hypothetical protein
MRNTTGAPAAPSRTHWWRKVRYRVEQFFGGLLAGAEAIDDAPAQAILSPAELLLFRRMPSDARRHSLRVLQTLQAQAATPAELAAAALLHDVGKTAASEAGAYLGLWLRGPMVLAETFVPQVLVRLADPRPASSLRYAIYVQLHHAEIGAAWAQTAGASPVTCWLIAQHQVKGERVDTPEGVWLARLQAADDLN